MLLSTRHFWNQLLQEHAHIAEGCKLNSRSCNYKNKFPMIQSREIQGGSAHSAVRILISIFSRGSYISLLEQKLTQVLR